MLAEDISGIRAQGAEWSIVAMPSMPGLTYHTAELLGIRLSDITEEISKHI